MHTMKDYRILLVVQTVLFIFLTLDDIKSVHCGITDLIDKQFKTYAFIKPKLIHAKHKREIRSTKTDPNGLEHIHGITLKFVDKGKEYIVDLSLNRELIPVNYFEKHQKNGAYVINRPNATEFEFCNYNGKIRDAPDSWAAISTCDGISGMFFDGDAYHYIEKIESESGDKYHVLYKHDDLRTNYTCGYPSTPPELLLNQTKRAKRNTRSLKGPYNQNDKSRFIELVIVVDLEEYIFFDKELPKVYQHTKDIANIINSLFIPLNIFVSLVGVVVWTEQNEIIIDKNGDNTLTKFLEYRREHLVKDHPNDNAQLLTKIQFENGIVGKALKGPICTYEFSGGVNSDHSHVRSLVATTIAHEMGHNLGMEHDNEDCECPDNKCVMAPSSGVLSPTHWSSCSMEYLALAFEHGMDYCLRKKPKTLFDSPVCGNSFVEEGEECDCGLKNMCNNPCCNPETCKLFDNATCATGQCCDLNTCSLKSAGLECRSAVHECDLPEYCSGKSEYCPENVFKMNGLPCANNEAFCYEGSCRTQTNQCRLLWGPTGESSSPRCYKLNSRGSQNGNCGYNHLDQTYRKCNDESVTCGLLQCTHKNERLEFGMETVSVVAHQFLPDPVASIPCRTVNVDLGLNEIDPGLTPDGAYCGVNKMCVNQTCMAVSDLKARYKTCPDNCNGKGVCNNKGNCHCFIGYASPNCNEPGPGGSEDSGPASSPNSFKGFMTGMFVLTFGAIPLLLAVVLFAYCSKNHRSQSDWNKTHRIKLSNDAEVGIKPNGTVSPSSTLLINNQKPSILHKELLGNYKGFSIKPLMTNEQPTASRTPIRSAPSVPPVAIVSRENITKGARPQISKPVLDTTTSSAVHELVSIPLKPAPPIPTVNRPVSTVTVHNKNNVGDSCGGGYPTLRRIASFMKNQKPEEKKPTIVRANAKFDKEVLKTLEISQPILQNEINVPSEPLPLEADQHKAVVLRANSLRTTNNSKHRPSVPNFGSIRSKRPTSVAAVTLGPSITSAVTLGASTTSAVCSRPKAPPPQPPPPPALPMFQDGYQIPRPPSDRHNKPANLPLNCDDNNESLLENIYSVIDENPIVDDVADDSTYKVPRSLESSLLGEIVSAIQERNHDSIYTSKSSSTDGPQLQQQTYENFKSSSPVSTTSSGYMRPLDIKLRIASYDRPDLVKNCDENRSLNNSPDVLEAKKPSTTKKPTVLFPKPVIDVTIKPSSTVISVGLKKKLSDNRRPSKVATNNQKKFENTGNVSKNPPVMAKPTISSNR